ncbi:hypothetical protein KJY78_03395 [Canibacter sp. lx-45]|uniref:hypothetical protein n=1 Tax=Canibacter zhuwentaonis TaxID=2837491 RepID=UPI001BDD7BBF|nr:hypothetical protein [Canibacter zhuwentaonis]MBT1035395.1 hypothetical protein [Canibacter zhuwentaonis]
MKPFRFFLTRIFLRKPLLAAITLILLFIANYTTFTVARTVVSTAEGRQEVARFEAPGTFIANLDPAAKNDLNDISTDSLQSVYNRLAADYEYALFTDGYITDLPNSRKIEVPVAYMNQKYNELNGFTVAEGSGLSFSPDFNKSDEIPVLVGKGLAADYPVGAKFSMLDPATDRTLRYIVSGILATNSAHSNLYALDSKQYYNFSVVVPVTESYIKSTGTAFKINALMDLTLTNTTRSEVTSLGTYIEQLISLKFNFFSQQDNINFYNKHFGSAMFTLVLVTTLLVLLIVALSVYSSLAGVKIMMREFTISILAGLSYKKFRRLIATYYALLALLTTSALTVLVAYSRYASWLKKDADLITYGFGGGLISMDWMALLSALLVNIILVTVVTQVTTWRIKRVPISIGILQ